MPVVAAVVAADVADAVIDAVDAVPAASAGLVLVHRHIKSH